MEYNTARSKMLMPEYGRNVQKMVEVLLSIEDPDRRLKNAEAIVELMSTLAPHLKAIEDYKHKLWDHLYQMTDYRLEVDGPYPPPQREEIQRRPERLSYPTSGRKNKHFGRNFSELLDKALAEEDPEKRQGFTQLLGYYMKLAYANWHKEQVHDDMIRNELAALSKGELHFEPGGYKVHVDLRQGSKPSRGNGRGHKNGSGAKTYSGHKGRNKYKKKQ